MSEKPDLIIVGHGSPETIANVQFERLVEGYRRRHPEFTVHHAYIELAEPLLDQTLDRVAKTGGQSMVLMPLILLRAGHVKHDIPEAVKKVQAAYPHKRFLVSEVLGVEQRMVQIIRHRANECGVPTGRPFVDGQPPSGHGCNGAIKNSATQKAPVNKTTDAVIFVGRGCSDADANGNVCKLARLLAEECGGTPVFPCFIGVTRPTFEETLHLAALTRPRRISIIPYFLFHGVLVNRIHEQARQFGETHPELPIQIASHLDGDGNLFELMDERLAETWSRS